MIKEVLTIVLLGLADAQKSVKLKNVDVLTLYAGRMTTGRRSAPVPQLQCMGGSAGCSAFVPTVVQCYNRGSDGQDIQWECKADMEMKYKFGQVQVTCEGFDYPDDPYVLAGSCGLEYTIDRVGSSSSHSSNNAGTSFWSSSNSNTDTSEEGSWALFIIIGFVIYLLVTNLNSSSDDSSTIQPRLYPTCRQQSQQWLVLWLRFWQSELQFQRWSWIRNWIRNRCCNRLCGGKCARAIAEKKRMVRRQQLVWRQ